MNDARELEEQGLESTNSAVYSRALGHRGDVVAVMRDRRAGQNGGDIALLEADEDEIPQPSAHELEEDLQQLEASYAALHASLERIWQLDAEGGLDEATFTRKLWLENTLTKNLQAQERLRPQLDAAKLKDAVEAAQTQHDALIPDVRALAEQAVQAVASLTTALHALEAAFVAQSDPFFPFRSRHGHQQFDLLDGRSELVNFVGRLFPQDFRSADMTRLLLDVPVTQGRATEALEACPRLHVFPERLLHRYLTEMEGYSHASTT